MPFPIRTLERARVFAPRACVWMVACSVLVFQPGGLFRFTWIKVVWLLVAVGVGALSRPGAGCRRASGGSCGPPPLCWPFLQHSPPTPWPVSWGAGHGSKAPWSLRCISPSLRLVPRSSAGRTGPGIGPLSAAALTPAVVIVSVISAFEAAGLRPLGGAADLRPGATLGNATDQGIIGVMAAAVLALPALRGRDLASPDRPRRGGPDHGPVGFPGGDTRPGRRRPCAGSGRRQSPGPSAGPGPSWPAPPPSASWEPRRLRHSSRPGPALQRGHGQWPLAPVGRER